MSPWPVEAGSYALMGICAALPDHLISPVWSSFHLSARRIYTGVSAEGRRPPCRGRSFVIGSRDLVRLKQYIAATAKASRLARFCLRSHSSHPMSGTTHFDRSEQQSEQMSEEPRLWVPSLMDPTSTYFSWEGNDGWVPDQWTFADGSSAFMPARSAEYSYEYTGYTNDASGIGVKRRRDSGDMPGASGSTKKAKRSAICQDLPALSLPLSLATELGCLTINAEGDLSNFLTDVELVVKYPEVCAQGDVTISSGSIQYADKGSARSGKFRDIEEKELAEILSETYPNRVFSVGRQDISGPQTISSVEDEISQSGNDVESGFSMTYSRGGEEELWAGDVDVETMMAVNRLEGLPLQRGDRIYTNASLVLSIPSKRKIRTLVRGDAARIGDNRIEDVDGSDAIRLREDPGLLGQPVDKVGGSDFQARRLFARDKLENNLDRLSGFDNPCGCAEQWKADSLIQSLTGRERLCKVSGSESCQIQPANELVIDTLRCHRFRPPPIRVPRPRSLRWDPRFEMDRRLCWRCIRLASIGQDRSEVVSCS